MFFPNVREKCKVNYENGKLGGRPKGSKNKNPEKPNGLIENPEEPKDINKDISNIILDSKSTLTYEYPFNDYKIPNFVPPKRVISNDEIQKILDCTDFKNVWDEYARDICDFIRVKAAVIELLSKFCSNHSNNHFILISRSSISS